MDKPIILVVDTGRHEETAYLVGAFIGSGFSVLDIDRTIVRVAGRGLPGDPLDVLDLPYTMVGQRFIGVGQAQCRPVAPYRPVGGKRRHRRNRAKMSDRLLAGETVVGPSVVTPEMEARFDRI